MSSPKRAAKSVAKSAAKVAAKPAAKAAIKPARHLSVARPPAASANGATADAKRLAAEIERGIAAGNLDVVATDALQALLAAAGRVYTARTEAGEQLMPVPKNSVSATDVMVTASGLLRAADLAVFELGMWQSWTGR
jgi:hypothetical protein